jgi:hypothetical protein
MAAIPPVWDVSTTGSGDADVVANVIAFTVLAGCAMASYLVTRRAGRRDGSMSIDDESAVGASADREPATVP